MKGRAEELNEKKETIQIPEPKKILLDVYKNEGIDK